jgi:hypothetical protein
MRTKARKLRRSLVRTDVTVMKSPAQAPAGPVQLRHLEKMGPWTRREPLRFRWYRLRLLPRAVQLCIHCRKSPAGFWVSRKDSKTVHRPWCLSCCDGLDRGRCDVTPFGV